MYTCFFICPIGENDSEIRRNSDDLRDLIIKPALEPFGFNIERGDEHSEQGNIDNAVIRAIQDAELCIVDISLPNPNVFYELGRRDETGKPLILLRSVDGCKVPVDIATRRYVEYDLDSRRGIIDATVKLKEFITPIVKNGFETSGSGSSLSEIAEILKRVERKLDRMGQNGGTSSDRPKIDPNSDDMDPVDLLHLSMRQRNIPAAEKAMDMLSYRMPHLKWLDQVVSQVAAIGSIKAGNLLVENAMEFMDNTDSFSDKLDYLSCLVSNLLRTDRGLEHQELAEELFASLEAVSHNEPSRHQVRLYNQLNKLYYEISTEVRDPAEKKKWINKAIGSLEKVLAIDDNVGFLHFNLSTCLQSRNGPDDIERAIHHALRAIECDGDELDDDHLEHVCELMQAAKDPRLPDYLEMLAGINPIKAELLRVRFGRRS